MKYYHLLIILTIGVISSSCGSEEEADPRDIFFASYTAEEFCMDGGSFSSTISAAPNIDEIRWVNFLGEDGPTDDLVAKVTGNNISISRQAVQNLELEGQGILLSNGDIDFDLTVYAGPLAVFCNMVYSPN